MSSFDHVFLASLREHQLKTLAVNTDQSRIPVDLSTQDYVTTSDDSSKSFEVNPELTKLLHLHSATTDDGGIQELPSAEVTNHWDVGANLQLAAVDESVVDRFHARGQIVGIWFSKRHYQEGPELWA